MKISVAMPTYRGERFLGETFDSIRRQTRPPDELVISDDGSTDATDEIACRFARSAPFAVQIVRHVPAGVTDNYLNALRLTSGDLVIFADQDDVWRADKIAVLEAAFRADPRAALVASDSALVDEGLRPLGETLRGGRRRSARLARTVNAGDDFRQFLIGLPLLAHTLAVRAVCRAPILNKPAEPAGWWFESWASSVAVCHGRLRLVPDALTLYRQHAGQTAGAPRGAPPAAGLADFAKRLDELRYCRRLLLDVAAPRRFDDYERSHRLGQLDEYLAFLERRTCRWGRSYWHRLWTPARLLSTGQYHRFARGWMSFARDLLPC
jgi:glycosyltransferase involved in cell wall biosynthesis